ncbi:ABC transporter substrate-binding protein [Methylobacterium nodulans]|uniref:Toluene tolerance family protein n=1 Tax=Methylobacterium nodulans (strain LMG 21967 / CNCM I-2342 / ORS 2060) TaxID=460265 RepID=B8IKA7_METNO|nr:ABC transporter substrate-binding protein [Methylobacterium nodulans]ACL61892.1 toluene tolerance family protein [Methylobacterium nodulans ORS 2060]
MRNRREILRAGLVTAGLAAVGFGLQPARAADDPAVATVRRMTEAFQEALKSPDVRGRVAVLTAPMAESFDLPAMLRLAIGSRWKNIPADKQAALIEAFGPYLTATYATRLSAAAGGRFRVPPKSEPRGSGRIVRSTAIDASGDESPVDYITNAEGKITDVYLQGTISEAGTLRTNFSDPLKSGGADALLEYMRKTTATMLAAPSPAPNPGSAPNAAVGGASDQPGAAKP